MKLKLAKIWLGTVGGLIVLYFIILPFIMDIKFGLIMFGLYFFVGITTWALELISR